MTSQRSVGSSGLDGITFNDTVELKDLFKTHDIQEVIQEVCDGTKHHIYRPPRTKVKFCKKAPLYTKEYTMDDVFEYVLQDQAGQYIHTKFSELLTARKKLIRRLFEFYKVNVGKFNRATAKDFEGSRPYVGRTLLQLCQADILQRENVVSKGTQQYVYTKSEDVVSDKDVITKLVQNSEKILGWGNPREKALPKSTTPVGEESRDDLMGTDLEENVLETSKTSQKNAPVELKDFNDGWFQFNELFPNLTFDDYLNIFLRNRQQPK